MPTNLALPPGYKYVKAHSNKWAIFEETEGMLGYVRRTNRTLRGADYVFYYRKPDDVNWSGPYPSRDEAAKALILWVEGAKTV